MDDITIKVEGLGKKYRIGQSRSGDLRETFGNFFRKSSGNQQINLADQQTGVSTNQSTDFWALKEISFEIPRGEAVGIIGRNGAGKSTLLKILSRISEPTIGRVEINGRVSSLLEVGTGFHPELTGRENVYLNGTILGMKRNEVKSKFDEIVDFSGVEKFLETPIKHYSSGMKVRLAFSVAAHLEPDILLIDEVLAVGDAEFQKKCLGKMEDVTTQGRTVLFVSHNLTALQNLCSNAILLENGKLTGFSSSPKVIEKYLSSGAKVDEGFPESDNIVRFKAVHFVQQNNETKFPIMGQHLQIILEIENGGMVDIDRATVSIGFFSSGGSFLFSCNSAALGKSFQIAQGRSKITCVLTYLPLLPGNYSYNLKMDYRGGVLDWVKGAGSIRVEGSDIYKTGRLSGSNYEGVVVDFDWR